jgi:hypothetical protein
MDGWCMDMLVGWFVIALKRFCSNTSLVCKLDAPAVPAMVIYCSMYLLVYTITQSQRCCHADTVKLMQTNSIGHTDANE